MNLLLTCYLHFQEEVAAFGRDVMPIVREKEKDLARAHGTELNTDMLSIAPGVSTEEAAAATAETLPADHPAKVGVAA